MRPTDRAANLRRARRRTLFAPTVVPRLEPPVDPEVEVEVAPVVPVVTVGTVATDDATPDGGLDLMTDLALEEFVIDDDDYPEVSAAQRRVAPAASEPDRVDDIDQWLEEFAVSDCL